MKYFLLIVLLNVTGCSGRTVRDNNGLFTATRERCSQLDRVESFYKDSNISVSITNIAVVDVDRIEDLEHFAFYKNPTFVQNIKPLLLDGDRVLFVEYKRPNFYHGVFVFARGQCVIDFVGGPIS